MDEQQVLDDASSIISQIEWRKAGQPPEEPAALAQQEANRCVLLPLGVLWIAALCALGMLTVLYAEKSRKLDAVEVQCINLSVALSAVEGQLLGAEREFEKLQDKINNLSQTGQLGSCSSCAAGWRFHGGKCYFFSTSRMNWAQSRDFCVSKGAHLVIVNSDTEQTFILMNAKERHWIGLSSAAAEGHWVWVDNTPVTAGAQFWAQGQWSTQKHRGEDCATVDVSLGWVHKRCSAVDKFVCETLATS